MILIDSGPALTISFTYDENGIRQTKTSARSAGSVTTRYHYNGKALMGQSDGTHTLLFSYDGNGNAASVRFNGTDYYYLYNGQGDVVKLIDGNGATQVEYTYDTWGACTTTGAMAGTLGLKNPFRYRGYVYDSDTGLYYLESRYYDPETGRFLSSDTLMSTGQSALGYNMFAYCGNNPVVRKDSGGAFWETVFDLISLGASIVEVCVNPADPWAWAGFAGDAIDLIPFVTGVGEITRAAKTVNKVADTVQIAKAVDFTEDAVDIVRGLDRAGGFTKSTAELGRRIHNGYKATDDFLQTGKEYRRIKGMRPDYIDFNTKTIYELKPYNPRSMKAGLKQLQRYNQLLGGGFKMRLEWY